MIKSLQDGVAFPFKDGDWPLKLWPLPIIAYVPVLNLVLLLGWRMGLVRSLANGHEGLPKFDLEAVFRDGVTLFLVSILYFFVPGIIAALLGVGGPVGFIVDIYEIVTLTSEEFIKDQASDWMTSLMIYAFWALFSAPVFAAAQLRYARTGNIVTLLAVPANIAFVLRHGLQFIKFYCVALLFMLFIAAIDALLLLTGLGTVLLPMVTLISYHILVGHELGMLARKTNKQIEAGTDLTSAEQPAPPLSQ